MSLKQTEVRASGLWVGLCPFWRKLRMELPFAQPSAALGARCPLRPRSLSSALPPPAALLGDCSAPDSLASPVLHLRHLPSPPWQRGSAPPTPSPLNFPSPQAAVCRCGSRLPPPRATYACPEGAALIHSYRRESSVLAVRGSSLWSFACEEAAAAGGRKCSGRSSAQMAAERRWALGRGEEKRCCLPP